MRNRLRGNKWSASDGQVRSPRVPPAISLGPAQAANSLCWGQEARTVRESELQSGNSGYFREKPLDKRSGTS